jgi:hypothetical protein
MESKEELEKELEDLKTEQKEREKVEKMKKEIQALKAKQSQAAPAQQPRKDIGGSGIVDMLSRNHYRNGIFLLGLFCGLLTQLVF